ncbi:hypothetical protein ACLOJK_027466 [Asimina triloba]
MSVPYGDPESENFGSTMKTEGAAGPNHNPEKKKGSTLHERLTQQEVQLQSFAERVLTQLDVLQRRLDGNPQQQEIEVVVQGQATVETQEGERAVTKSKAADVGGHTVGRRRHASEEGQDYRIFESKQVKITWERFLEAFYVKFFPLMVRVAKAREFTKLKQSDMSVANCETKFSDKDQRVNGLKTRSNEATGRNAADAISAILDVSTFNQGRVISAKKLVIDQMTILKEWCVIGPGYNSRLGLDGQMGDMNKPAKQEDYDPSIRSKGLVRGEQTKGVTSDHSLASFEEA